MYIFKLNNLLVHIFENLSCQRQNKIIVHKVRYIAGQFKMLFRFNAHLWPRIVSVVCLTDWYVIEKAHFLHFQNVLFFADIFYHVLQNNFLNFIFIVFVSLAPIPSVNWHVVAKLTLLLGCLCFGREFWVKQTDSQSVHLVDGSKGCCIFFCL